MLVIHRVGLSHHSLHICWKLRCNRMQHKFNEAGFLSEQVAISREREQEIADRKGQGIGSRDTTCMQPSLIV